MEPKERGMEMIDKLVTITKTTALGHFNKSDSNEAKTINHILVQDGKTYKIKKTTP